MSAPRTVEAAGPMPVRIAALPRDHRGYPVPWFVAKIKGEWDFRVIRPNGIPTAIQRALCWVCGQPLGAFGAAFVSGPMCAVNRTSAEPPSHHQCAVWAARACPFLAEPKAKRNERDRVDGSKQLPGIALRRNPGVAMVYPVGVGTASAYPIEDGWLFNMGEPIRRVRWFCEGRDATREECEHSIETGLPALMAVAEQEGPDAVAELERRVEWVRRELLPEPAGEER